MMKGGAVVAPAEIITTCGATEALMLCLRAVTQPGDTGGGRIPNLLWYLARARSPGRCGLLEIPADPVSGMKLDVLERVLKKQPVNACIALPSLQQSPRCLDVRRVPSNGWSMLSEAARASP